MIGAEEPQRREQQRLQAELDEQLQQSATEEKKIFDAQIAKVRQVRRTGRLREPWVAAKLDSLMRGAAAIRMLTILFCLILVFCFLLFLQMSASGIVMDPSNTTLAQLDAAVRPLRESSQLLTAELEEKIERLQTEMDAKQQRVDERSKELQELQAEVAELNQQV